MKTITFWWVSQIGMLAGTAVYVYAGSTFPNLEALAERGAGGILNLPTLLALAALGTFPLAAKRMMAAVQSRRRSSLHPSIETTA